MERVTIIQRVLPHYRTSFFRRLRARLSERGVDLQLVYGQEWPGTVPRTTALHEPWARRIDNRYFHLRGKELIWQPCMTLIRGSALAIIEQSTRLLVNYPLLARTSFGQGKLAFWGHGRNLQSLRPGSWSERIKRITTLHADWWFAYTSLSADVVAASGFPRSRITDVQNTIDTSEFGANLDQCSDAEVSAAKETLGITGNRVGLYCGGMYELKRLPFLMEACLVIKKIVPDFAAVFVGDGPETGVVTEMAGRHEWIHYVGPKVGRELAPYYKMASALLMPGLVGLAIVDSFVARVPLFTTDLPIHSPEISYLANQENGIMTPPTVEAFAAIVARYLQDVDMQQRLQDGCARSASRYTIENMVERFSSGIELCLGRKPLNATSSCAAR